MRVRRLVKIEASYDIDQGGKMTRQQAKEWLSTAAAVGHGGSCYCRPCEIARKRLRPRNIGKTVKKYPKWKQLSLPFPEKNP